MLRLVLLLLPLVPAVGSAAIHTVLSGQSIQAAVDRAASGDVIEVEPGIYHQPILVKGKTLVVRAKQGPEVTVLDGEGARGPMVSFFEPSSNGSVLEGFTINNGANPGGGGGAVTIQNGANVTIRGNVISGNQALIGAGLYVYLNSIAVAIDNRFQNNQATGANTGGGAIAASHGGYQFIIGNEFIGNSALGNPASGGAVFISQGSGAMIDSNYFEGNSCEYPARDIASGGAVHVIHDTRPGGGLIISNNNFVGNTANYGGAVGQEDGASLMMVNNTFRSNRANYYGGAFLSHAEVRSGAYNIDGSLYDMIIDGNTFEGNGAAEHGGALFFSWGGKARVSSNLLSNNDAGISGGAIHVDSANSPVSTEVQVVDNTLENNQAGNYGGAVTVTDRSDVVLERNDLAANRVASSDGKGAGVYVAGATLEIQKNGFLNHNCAVSNCSGGALFVTGALATLESENNVFALNTATYGSAVFVENSTFSSQFDTYADNRSLSRDSQVRAVIFPRSSQVFLHQAALLNPDQAVSSFDRNNVVSLKDIQARPVFVNRGGSEPEDYRLAAGSSGIDQVSSGIPEDFEGRLRPVGGAFDVGAFEYSSEKYISPITLHRFWNTQKHVHFFTAALSERNFVLQNVEWQYDGPTFRVFTANNHPAGTTPVYRFYNPDGGHFYTADETERQTFENDSAWSAEGAVFHAFSEPSGLYESKPVYRFTNKLNGAYFYTIDDGEKDFTMGLSDWQYEGVAYYGITAGY